MWQPNRSQWAIISTVAVLGVLAWPPDRATGQSLVVKTIRWAADPSNSLPSLPPPLPPALDDDGDAVAAHDALEAEYYRRYNSSAVTRRRLLAKNFSDPFDPVTERQLIVAVVVVAALGVWRLQRR